MNIRIMCMVECRTTVLGVDQHMYGVRKEFAIPIGKKFRLEMVLTLFLTKTIHVMDGL